jgi:hypothetical protein
MVMRMKTVYKDDAITRRTLKSLGGDVVMEERVSEEEFFEIHKLKNESVRGEHVEWGKLKKELFL